MKNLIKKSLSLLLLSILSAIVYQSCQKDEYFASKNEIFNSKEFIEYVNSGIIAYGSIVDQIIQLSEPSKPNPDANLVIIDSAIYEVQKIKSPSQLLQRTRLDMKNKYLALVEKYPNYLNYTPEEIIQYVYKAYTTAKIQQTISEYKFFDKQSSLKISKARPDLDPGQTYYADYYDAFAAAIAYSNLYQVECGGLVFTNGTAALYIYEGATHSSTLLIPESLTSSIVTVNGHSYYNGMEIASTFHVHFNNYIPSSADNDIQTVYFPNCSLTIIYDDWWFIWLYRNGLIYPVPQK